MNTFKNAPRPSFWSAFLDGLLPSWESDWRRAEPASDIERMRDDWRRIGGDFRGAIKKADAEHRAARR